jgi:hypothetical protein
MSIKTCLTFCSVTIILICTSVSFGCLIQLGIELNIVTDVSKHICDVMYKEASYGNCCGKNWTGIVGYCMLGPFHDWIKEEICGDYRVVCGDSEADVMSQLYKYQVGRSFICYNRKGWRSYETGIIWTGIHKINFNLYNAGIVFIGLGIFFLVFTLICYICLLCCNKRN